MGLMLYGKVTLKILPRYQPNDEERADPALYASGVRAKIAAALGNLPVTSHSFDDVWIEEAARVNGVPQTFVMSELRAATGLDVNGTLALLDQFGTLCRSSLSSSGARGRVTENAFCAAA